MLFRKFLVFRERPQLGDSKQTLCQSVRDVEQRVGDLEGDVVGIGVEFAAEAEDEVEGDFAGVIEDWVAGFELGLDADGVGGGVCVCVVAGGVSARGFAVVAAFGPVVDGGEGEGGWGHCGCGWECGWYAFRCSTQDMYMCA